MEIQLKEITEIVLLSLRVTFTATIVATIISLILSTFIYLKNFKLKKCLITIINSFMSTPPVVMGLVVYLLLSRKGAFGSFNLLFTPTAMIIAQTMLMIPIAMTLIFDALEKFGEEILETCKILQVTKRETIKIFIREIRNHLVTVLIAVFGRGISEVGAVMLVGGNIRGSTRVMTTYISLSTSMGNFDESLIIAAILLSISFISTFFIKTLQKDV